MRRIDILLKPGFSSYTLRGSAYTDIRSNATLSSRVTVQPTLSHELISFRIATSFFNLQRREIF